MKLTIEDSELKTLHADSRGRVTLGKDYANDSVTIVVPDKVWGIEETQPFHVRHHPGPDITEDGLRRMASDRRFGIHWGDQILTSKWFYQKLAENKGRGPNDDMNNMHRISENGGLVSVEYNGIWPSMVEDVMLLGRVKPHTPILPREYEFKGEENNTSEYMKTLKMVDVVEAPKEEFPKLWEEKPRRGSIRRWNSNPERPRKVYAELI